MPVISQRTIRWIHASVIAFVLVLGLARISFDPEVLNLLPDNLEAAQGLKLYQKHFADSDEVLVTIAGSSSDVVDLALTNLIQTLERRSDLVKDFSYEAPWREAPGELAELTAFLWLNQTPQVFSEMAGRLAPTNLSNTLQESLNELQSTYSPEALALLGYDPYKLLRIPGMSSGGAGEEDFFVSSDGLFRVIILNPAVPLAGYNACRDFIAALRSECASVEQRIGDADIRLTGRPAFVADIGGGMEKDMSGSVSGTLVVIGILFWLTHRNLRALFILAAALGFILLSTIAAGGLALGTLNIISLGFGAILAGLAEDFGIVIYEEVQAHPGFSAAELRRITAPGIWASAVTTAGAFSILNLSVLPGLRQLGTLVALGIILAAIIMLYGYLPLLVRLASKQSKNVAITNSSNGEGFRLFSAKKLIPAQMVLALSGLLFLGGVGSILYFGLQFNKAPNVFRPRQSDAYEALDLIQKKFGAGNESLMVTISARDLSAAGAKLLTLQKFLLEEKRQGVIADFNLPDPNWFNSDNQQTNAAALRTILGNRSLIEGEAIQAGFTTNSLQMTSRMFDFWQRATNQNPIPWPANKTVDFILSKFVSTNTSDVLLLAKITPASAEGTKTFLQHWPHAFKDSGLLLSGWELLGTSVARDVLAELPLIMVLILTLVLGTLYLAYRSFKLVLISLAFLALSGLLLLGLMPLLGWQWNLLNIAGLPLLLGMGVDFLIHIQLALMREKDDVLRVRQTIGRALLLAGSTTVVAFGSLAFSSNAGMASLGQVCALGILITLVVAVYVLPSFWAVVIGRGRH